MNDKDKKRLEELQGKKVYLESQCYLLKKSLEFNEQEISRVVVVLAEFKAEEKPEE